MSRLRKLRGRTDGFDSSADVFTAFMAFLAVSSKFGLEFVIERMGGSVKSAVTELRDFVERVKQDLDSSKQSSKPNTQAALDDGQQVSTALTGLKSARGQS